MSTVLDESQRKLPHTSTVVTGVIHPQGASGVKQRSGDGWILQFAFESWRGADGVINHHKLNIRQPLSKEELALAMRRIPPYAVLGAKVIMLGATSAELVELLYVTADESDPLVQHAAMLQQAKTFEHPRFGVLTLDRSAEHYTTAAPWGETEDDAEPIQLHITATNEADLKAGLQIAEALWDDQVSWDDQLRDFAAEQLLTLRNTSWRSDDDPELTPDEFKERLQLNFVTISPRLDFTFWFDDGDMFWGHLVQVSGNLQDGIIDADIAG